MNFASASNPNIAIIMPAFNAEATIERAILSVINQSYAEWRLYIIDDCSTDGTLAKINSYLNDNRITLIKNQENLGVARTRNAGLLHCQEQIISFIDSDDEWLPNKLAIQIVALADQPGIAATAYFHIDKQKTLLLASKYSVLTLEQFIKKEFRVCFSSIMINRGRHENILFDDLGHEDFLYLYQWISVFQTMAIANQPLVNYYVAVGSVSSDKVKACKWHYLILMNICIFNTLQLVNYMFFYFIHALQIIIKKKFTS